MRICPNGHEMTPENTYPASGRCKICRAQLHLRWVRANRDRHREYMRRYRAAHRDEINAWARQYRAANADKARAASRQYYQQMDDMSRSGRRLRDRLTKRRKRRQQLQLEKEVA